MSLRMSARRSSLTRAEHRDRSGGPTASGSSFLSWPRARRASSAPSSTRQAHELVHEGRDSRSSSFGSSMCFHAHHARAGARAPDRLLTQPGVTLPPGMDTGLRAGGVAKGLMTKTISSQIKSMASKFIAGTDANAAATEAALGPRHRFLGGPLGEACVSDVEADEYRDKYLDLINNLPGEVSGWKANKQIETDHLGRSRGATCRSRSRVSRRRSIRSTRRARSAT